MASTPVAHDEMNEYGDAEWSPQPEELDRDRLNQLNPSGKMRWSLRHEIDPGQLAEELAKRLDNASHLLVDRLFSYLSSIPTEESHRINHTGLTLPASAIGWLSTQMYPRSNEADPLLETQSDVAWMGASMRDRLALLKYLLPRATHLRVTSEEWPPPFRKNTASNRTTDFTGRDLDLSNISVHSGVTIETSFNVATTPSIQSFLLFYNQIQNKPRVDLQVFPNLAVLFLDRIPAEWVSNLVALNDTLKLIRTERGCIFDMTRFLFGDDENCDDSRALTKLTYIKINYAALGEMSGLRGNWRQESDVPTNTRIVRPPPLSRLPNLVSLSLAHNEIRTVKTALAGLASLSNLNRLDLAYNKISTMKGANRLLGNIKTLVLTGNSLTNVAGLEKLYSLENLYLGHNELGDVADIAGLGKLPELMNLFVNGNPFVEKDPLRYRVSVLDLFKSTRFYSLLPGATYRQLLQILPVLDGTPATKRELVGLKSLTFRQTLPKVEAPEKQGQTEAAMDLDSGFESTPQSADMIEQSMATLVIRSRRVTRKARRGRAVVSDGQPKHQPDPITAFPLKPLDLPKIEFSTQDVIASMALQTKPKLEQVKTQVSVSLESYEGFSHRGFVSISSVVAEEDSVHNMLTETDILLDQAQAAIDAADFFDYDDDETTLLDNYSSTSYIPRLKQITDSEPGAALDENEPTQARRHDDVISESVLTAHVGSKKTPSTRWFSTSSSTLDDETPIRGVMAQRQNTSLNPFDDEIQENEKSPPINLDFSLKSPTTGTDFLPRPSVAFPEGVWEDELSVPSSLGTDRISRSDFLSEDKYHEAEKDTVYDGPEGYKKLSVVVNLELYFRLFVFPAKDLDASNRSDLDEDLSLIAIDASPRIQLRPVDRNVAHNATKEALASTKIANLGETFKKVWQEDIIACGKSAARRVAPDKKLRRGFHGDPLFQDGSICFTAECRKIIVCTSDAAIYLIPGYDPVSMKFVENSSERKFPSPIPQEALFQNGIWPHALARLPIETLKRITIGFSFQRLILHFSPSSGVERSLLGDALTFILATSNRLATVKLLHHLQDLTKTTDELSIGKPKPDVIIDNEDKQVLEALSGAVAPCPIDVVIHYQVLHQRWKHGDRGTVRRACVITDSHIFLLDEDYVGDGSESYDAGSRTLAEVRYSLIDSAELTHIVEVQAASIDPQEITIIIRPQSSFQRNHNWRLFCRDGSGAERLVEDARKAMSLVSQEM